MPIAREPHVAQLDSPQYRPAQTIDGQRGRQVLICLTDHQTAQAFLGPASLEDADRGPDEDENEDDEGDHDPQDRAGGSTKHYEGMLQGSPAAFRSVAVAAYKLQEAIEVERFLEEG